MPTTMRAFAKNLKGLAEGLEDRTGRLVEEVAERVHGSLVLSTPVKTGNARSNWLVGVGAPRSGTVPIRSEAETINDGAAAIRGRVKGDTEVNITNDVDYLPLLDAGSSRQAPAGFVLKAVETGVRVAAQFRLLRGGGAL